MAIFALAILLSFSSVPMQASIIQGYDTSLASPGVYYGSGNPNTGFTTTTADMGDFGNLELGLKAINRYIGDATEVNDNYYVDPGATTVAGKTGSEWGFVYSVNTNVDLLQGGATVPSYHYNLLITDLNTLASAQFDPSLIADNATYGSTGFQNSEAPSFGFISVPLGYDMNANDTYQITLFADPVNGSVSDPSVSIKVHVGQSIVPEPVSMSLVGVGLLSLGIFGRRQQKKGRVS